MTTTPLVGRPVAPAFTIKPIEGNTNIISSTDSLPVWSGIETGLNGALINVIADPLFGYNGGFSQGLAQTTTPNFAANGAWTTGAAPLSSEGDGAYIVTAYAGPLSAPLATVSETVILAQTTTPFSAVGLAFLDMNTGLAASVVPKAGIYRDLTAEVAGLTTLHRYDGFPPQPFNRLIEDINAEISTLVRLAANGDPVRHGH